MDNGENGRPGVAVVLLVTMGPKLEQDSVIIHSQ